MIYIIGFFIMLLPSPPCSVNSVCPPSTTSKPNFVPPAQRKALVKLLGD